MFIPNNSGILKKVMQYDLYGQNTYSAPVTVSCGVVRLRGTSEETSVRADSSASRANADEMLNDVKILFPSTVSLAYGDIFTIAGFDLRVIGVEPRYAITGELDHYEVVFERAQL